MFDSCRFRIRRNGGLPLDVWPALHDALDRMPTVARKQPGGVATRFAKRCWTIGAPDSVWRGWPCPGFCVEKTDGNKKAPTPLGIKGFQGLCLYGWRPFVESQFLAEQAGFEPAVGY